MSQDHLKRQLDRTIEQFEHDNELLEVVWDTLRARRFETFDIPSDDLAEIEDSLRRDGEQCGIQFVNTMRC